MSVKIALGKTFDLLDELLVALGESAGP